MNRKETDLIAKALHKAKPASKKGMAPFDSWFNSVVSVKDALLEKGHIQEEERFLSIADHGIVRG